MADETQVAAPGEQEPLTDQQKSELGLAPITLKPSAIEPAPDNESKEDRMKRLNISDMPGHTYETEQIFKQRQEELAKQGEKPYEYKANGYTVKEVVSEDKAVLPTYIVTADGFEKGFNNKREAEIYASTHARFVNDEATNIQDVGTK